MCPEKKPRITNPYVLTCELKEPTGVEDVDDFLYTVVNLLQIGVGDFLRAMFVIGSYAHGGYRPDSDIDACFLWKDGVDLGDNRRKAFSIISHVVRCSKHWIDPMWNDVERPFYDAADFGDPDRQPCGPIMRLAVKQHSRLLCGEDVRPQIALGREEDMLTDVLLAALTWIRKTHGLESTDSRKAVAKIPLPLTVPSPEADDRGFGDLHRVTARVAHLARAWVFAETGKFLLCKPEIAPAFERHVGGPWAEFVREVHTAACEDASPETGERVHQAACRAMTGFENAFLTMLIDRGIDVHRGV